MTDAPTMRYLVSLEFRAASPDLHTAVFELRWPATRPPLAAPDTLAFPEPGRSPADHLSIRIKSITHSVPFTDDETGTTYLHAVMSTGPERLLRATPPADVARRLARFTCVGNVLLVRPDGSHEPITNADPQEPTP